MITDEERARRDKMRSELIAKAKASRKNTHAQLFAQVEAFEPTVGEYEADVVLGVSTYLNANAPVDRDSKAANDFVHEYAYLKHPGDADFRYEVSARLGNIIERRRLNMCQMSCDMGWEDVIHEFLAEVEMLPGFRMIDAREKWGMLRLKYTVNERTPELIAAEKRATEQSMVTCECCGEPGTHHKGGWWKTVCVKHTDYYKQTSDPWREVKARYADVYQPDPEPGARGWEMKYGWQSIMRVYLDQLRAWNEAGFAVKMRWSKEKFGALRVFDNVNYHTATRLQVFWIERLHEWVRRKSLQTCDMCNRDGRLRWGQYLATRCVEHATEMGAMREEDGIVLDADRQNFVLGKAVMNGCAYHVWSDKDVGLKHEGSTWFFEKQLRWDFAPMLSADVELPDDDNLLAALRVKLLAVDQAIGKHRDVEFKLQSYGDRLSYTVGIDPLYAEHAVSTVDEIAKQQIRDDIHEIMSAS